MSATRDHGLDAIRGGAILAVLVFYLRLDTGIPMLDRLLLPLVDLGWVGVDLFFVLSGLLVGGIILAEAETAAGFSRSRFFGRQALRLWPVLYLYLAALMLARPLAPLVALGTLSYSLHVWHVGFARLAEGIAPMLGIDGALAMTMCRYAAAILGAKIVHSLVERPFMALRNIEWPRKAPPIASNAIANEYQR